jgi:hypothetical protein
VQEGEVIVCLGGTSKAHTAVHKKDDGDGSFVIEDAVNGACRCPTLNQPLFHRNQFNSYHLSKMFLACKNSNGFLDMAKRRPAPV